MSTDTSKTPRTDAVRFKIGMMDEGFDAVLVGDCEAIENELTAANAEIARLTAEREHNANMVGMWQACAEKMQAALQRCRLQVSEKDIASTQVMPALRPVIEAYNAEVTACLSSIDVALAAYARCLEGEPGAGGWNEIKFADDDLPRRDGKDILLGWLIKGCFSTSVVHWDACCEEWQRSDDDSYVDSLYYATHWKEIDPPAPATPTEK